MGSGWAMPLARRPSPGSDGRPAHGLLPARPCGPAPFSCAPPACPGPRPACPPTGRWVRRTPAAAPGSPARGSHLPQRRPRPLRPARGHRLRPGRPGLHPGLPLHPTEVRSSRSLRQGRFDARADIPSARVVSGCVRVAPAQGPASGLGGRPHPAGGPALRAARHPAEETPSRSLGPGCLDLGEATAFAQVARACTRLHHHPCAGADPAEVPAPGPDSPRPPNPAQAQAGAMPRPML